MRKVTASAVSLAIASTFGWSAPLLADGHSQAEAEEQKDRVTILERDEKGRATKVRIDGKDYDVCQTEDQDSCINPRSAGLDWGNRELNYWPGQPASLKDQ